jgi:hypothetical protein
MNFSVKHRNMDGMKVRSLGNGYANMLTLICKCSFHVQASESLLFSHLFMLLREIHLQRLWFLSENSISADFMISECSSFPAITVDPYAVYANFKYTETN